MVGDMRCRVAVMLAGTALLVAACGPTGRTSGTVADIETAAVVARIAPHCTDLERPDLGAGTVCFDSGFRIRTDDFSFPNWGRSASADANISVQTLVDLFGRGAVCMPAGSDGECIPRPTTQQILTEWNTALSGGRCEGMAAMAVRFRMGLDSPSDFSTGASTVAELSRSAGRLDSWIAYWWATQFIKETADAAEGSRTRSPIELVEEIVLGLSDERVGHTLGLYHGSGGHTVVPFAVTRRGSDFVVHVYDNNHPRERREIVVDPSTNRWTYVDAMPGETWSGGTGTFELTRMSSREGPFTCPFCTVPDDGAPATVTVASRDAAAPGYVLVRSDAGTVSSAPDGISNGIPGATATPTKGAGASITLGIPANVGTFTVSVRRGRSAVPAGDVVVTVRRPGHPTVQVSGNLAAKPVDDDRDDAVLRITPKDTTVVAPAADVARVSFTAGSDIVRRRLRAGETMIVDRPASNSIEIALKGAGRRETGRVLLPLRDLRSSTEIEVTDDAGAVVLVDSVVMPVTVSTPAAVNFVPRTRPVTTTVADSIVISDPD